MKITVIGVGTLKESFLKEGIAEFRKRISKYAKIEILEAEDEKIPQNASAKEKAQIKEKEASKIRALLPENSYIIALTLHQPMLSSEEFAEKMARIFTFRNSHIVFLIGGSLGLADSIVSAADECISFSKMTFPHQLFRLILLEQIYRAFKINSCETYHK